MRQTLFFSILCLTLLVPSSFAQAPAMDEAIDGLKTANKKKDDGDRVHFTKLIAESWEKADKKQRGKAIKEVKNAFRTRDDDTKLQLTEQVALLGGGEKLKDADASAKVLTGLLKKSEENPTLHQTLIMSIGKLKSPKASEALLKLLRHKDDQVRRSAVSALGFYDDSSLKLRKELFSELLKTYSSVSSKAQDVRDTTAQKRFKDMEGPMEQSLKKLTGVKDAKGVLAWTRWWNNTGKKAKEW